MYVKDPDARLEYAVDWSAWLPTGDTVTGSEWLSPDGLPTEDAGLDGAVARVWLSGGDNGVRYRITNRVTTAEGRIDDRTIVVSVRHR